MNYKYKGIVFAKDYNKSLAEFEKDFGTNHIFNEIPHLERPAEIKKVYNELIKHNGKFLDSSNKSEKHKTKPGS
jgi:hypothetical protein